MYYAYLFGMSAAYTLTVVSVLVSTIVSAVHSVSSFDLIGVIQSRSPGSEADIANGRCSAVTI